VKIRAIGRIGFDDAWQQMRAFTDARANDTEDELWIVEHAPVFTQGVAGRPEHLLINPSNIPVIKTDRGGQITYHGPGQAMVYILFDLRRAGYGVRELVVRIENAVIACLRGYGVETYGKRDAPGVYVRCLEPLSRFREDTSSSEAKVAALGLKIRNGCSYHGVALNVNMDLTPFSFINPCGYEGLAVTHLHDFGVNDPANDVAMRLARELQLLLALPPPPKA
jgi:lipoyl(octanoyl) transferase